jgi:hypothetical protein
MIDDRNPNFGRGFRVSSAELGDLRERWRDLGRQVWEAGTRLGRDIKAQTEQQLEALGRDYLRQDELQKAQARAVGQAAKRAAQASVDTARRAGGAAKTTLAAAGGQITGSKAMERDVVRAMPAAAADLGGKAWSFPNTVVGLAYGGAGHLAGIATGTRPHVVIEGNAIQFRNNPFGGVGAITLGNTTTYDGDPSDPSGSWGGYNSTHAAPIQEHERQHTIQAQQLGPFYLPSNLLGGGVAMLREGDWHGPSNWNERGPQEPDPRPWPGARSW